MTAARLDRSDRGCSEPIGLRGVMAVPHYLALIVIGVLGSLPDVLHGRHGAEKRYPTTTEPVQPRHRPPVRDLLPPGLGLHRR